MLELLLPDLLKHDQSYSQDPASINKVAIDKDDMLDHGCPDMSPMQPIRMICD